MRRFELLAGELASCCPAMEADAVFLMCQHAACCPQHILFVTAVLASVSSALSYPSRRAYMEYHQATLVFAWIQAKNSFRALLTIQVGHQKSIPLSYNPASETADDW